MGCGCGGGGSGRSPVPPGLAADRRALIFDQQAAAALARADQYQRAADQFATAQTDDPAVDAANESRRVAYQTAADRENAAADVAMTAASEARAIAAQGE